MEADVEHLVVHAIRSATALSGGLRDIPSFLLLLPEIHGFLAAAVVLLEETVPLKAVDVSPHEDVHGLEPHHHIIPGTPRAVADPPAVWTKAVGFFLAIVVILEAVAAVLPPADILIIFLYRNVYSPYCSRSRNCDGPPNYSGIVWLRLVIAHLDKEGGTFEYLVDVGVVVGGGRDGTAVPTRVVLASD